MDPLSAIRKSTEMSVRKIRELAVLSKSGKLDFWKFIKRDIQDKIEKNILEGYNRFMVIVAGAGYGKTILLTQIAENLLKRDNFVPLLFQCDGIPQEPIKQALLSAVGIEGIPLSKVIDQAQEQKRSLVILIDTLDALRSEQLPEIRNLAALCSNRGVPLVGTCRPLEFSALQNIAESYELKGFQESKIKEILFAYQQKTGHPAPKMNQAFFDLCRIPLHLRMFFEVYDPKETVPTMNFIELFNLFRRKKVEDVREETLNRYNFRIIDKPRLCLTKFSVLSAFTLKLVEGNSWDLPKDKVTYLPFELSSGVIDKADPGELSFALHDLCDEGILSESESNRTTFLNESFFEYFIASYFICPMLRVPPSTSMLEEIQEILNSSRFLEFIKRSVRFAKKYKIDKMISLAPYVGRPFTILSLAGEVAPKLLDKRQKLKSARALFAIIDRGKEFKKIIDSLPIALLMEKDRERRKTFTRLLAKSKDPFHQEILRTYIAVIADKDPAELDEFF